MNTLCLVKESKMPFNNNDVPLNVDFLIVDDDEPVRSSLVRYLDDFEFSCAVFSSGEQALVYLERGGRARAAVFDVRLGGIQGDLLLEKALSIAPDITYMLYTGSVDFTLSASLVSLGITKKQVLLKPLSDLSILNKLVD